MPTVEVKLEDRILFLTLSRPEARNALDEEMVKALRAGFIRLAEDNDIAGLILTGTGPAFCSGIDLAHLDQGLDPRGFRWFSQQLTQLVRLAEIVEKPVVVALNGTVTGLGIALALAGDIRIASRESRFLFREGRIGLLAGHGGLTRLVRFVGLGRARDILLGGEEIDANKALQYGLVTEVVSPETLLEAARARLLKALERAPLSFGLTKRLLITAFSLGLDDMMFLETLGQSHLIGTEDHREGLRALREKRKPFFRGC